MRRAAARARAAAFTYRVQAMMFSSAAIMAVLNYAFSLLMARWLVPGDFGLLAFVQTVLLLAGLFLGSGIPWSLATIVATAPSQDYSRLVRGAVLANLGLALLIDALLALLFAAGPLQPGLETWPVLGLVALAIPAVSVIGVMVATAQGRERFGVVAGLHTIEIVVKAACGAILVRAGWGVNGAVCGFMMGSMTAASLGIWSIGRGKRMPGSIAWPRFSLAGPLFAALLVAALLQNLDVLAIKLLSGGDRAIAGAYQAATVLATAPYYLVPSALVPVLLPRLARRGELAKTGLVLAGAARLVVLVLVPIEAGLLLFPDLALRTLLAPKYLSAVPVLRILSVGNSALMLLAVVATAYQATGQARRSATVVGCAITLEIAALSVSVPVWHGVAASTCFTCAASGGLLVLGSRYLRSLEGQAGAAVRGWLGRYVVCAGAAAIAAGGMLLTPLGEPAAVAASLGVYAVAVWGLRLARG